MPRLLGKPQLAEKPVRPDKASQDESLQPPTSWQPLRPQTKAPGFINFHEDSRVAMPQNKRVRGPR